jgi:hypothetical protein
MTAYDLSHWGIDLSIRWYRHALNKSLSHDAVFPAHGGGGDRLHRRALEPILVIDVVPCWQYFLLQSLRAATTMCYAQHYRRASWSQQPPPPMEQVSPSDRSIVCPATFADTSTPSTAGQGNMPVSRM